ncbi:MAG: type III-E CRISPR-associated protein Csx30 [Thermodesulfobacteriota bacterium]
MSTEHGYGNSETASFAPALDLLLEWGRAALLIRPNGELLMELEGRWAYFRALELEPADGMDALEGAVETALAYLGGPETLDVETADAGRVVAAVQILDNVVFLAEAAESFPGADLLSAPMLARIDELLHQVTGDRSPPAARLIPLNDWRREYLRLIPKELRYLFPWYTAWADLPADLLDHLAEHWEEVSAGDVRLVGVEAETLYPLLAEIRSDTALLRRLQDDAQLLHLLPRVAAESLPLRLLALRQAEIASRRPVPDLGAVGLYPAARRLLEAPVRSRAEQTERILLAALCAPYLDDARRLALLGEVERNLSGRAGLWTSGAEALEALDLWEGGGMADAALADRIWIIWNQRLRAAAAAIDPVAGIEAALQKLTDARDRSPISDPPARVQSPEPGPSPKRKPRRRWIAGAAAAGFAALFVTALVDFGPDSVVVETSNRAVTRKMPTPASDLESPPALEPLPSFRLDRLSDPREIPDPFAPLFDKNGKAGGTTETAADGLTGVDLDQLRLVGIVRTANGAGVMLEGPGNRGYTARQGDPVGAEGGRIAEIRDRAVVIEGPEAERRELPLRTVVRLGEGQ